LLLSDLVQTSRTVAATSGRRAKIEHLADLLNRAGPDEIEIAIAFLSGTIRQSKTGVGFATLRAARPDHAAAEPSLELLSIDSRLSQLASTTGKGSATTKAQTLRDLMARATRAEQEFLFRLLTGELRQGALEGLMTDAVAHALGLPVEQVRRAAVLAGDLGMVARAGLAEGAHGLSRFAIELFRPIQPMLAQAADTVADALARLGQAAFEYKLDGARIQVHRSGDEVRVFSRLLNDVTAAVPEVVEAVSAFPARELILDGEAIALQPGGAPHPFQVTMRRFGSRKDVARQRVALPLSSFFFDILVADGVVLLDEPHSRRADALAAIVPDGHRVPRIVTSAVPEARAFFARAIADGHEGVMAKALEVGYEAGARGSAWLKVKQTHTLDLVVLAAEWGHGRRRGWLSNLHLGARDAERGGFVMLGKTFKGMTDAMLAWQTERLKALAANTEGQVVAVRPELVVEVAFNGLQASTHYPGGLALRFARVVRYRPDKRPEDADTITTVRDLHHGLPRQ